MRRSIFITTLALAGLSSTAYADVRFVDEGAAGAQDGTSWEDAFVSLSDALAASAAGDEVWVAEGVYRPSEVGSEWTVVGETDPGPRFEIPAGVTVRGGFTGDEASVEERSGSGVTVLSGDLEQDDVYDAGGFVAEVRGQNARHVVTMTGVGATLEGVVVTGGDAGRYDGGGIFVHDAVVTIAEVVVAGNYARAGAGMAIVGRGEPTVTRSVIAANEATSHGGGVLVDLSMASFDNVVVSGNVALVGAGIWLSGSPARFAFVDVTGNRAHHVAGGVYVGDEGEPRIEASILYGNEDRDGSADASLRLVGGTARAAVSHSLVEGADAWGRRVRDLGGNFDAAPGFAEPLAAADAPSMGGDFRLELGSPARDRGPLVSNEMVDIERRPRALDGDGDGLERPDLGAFEAAAMPAPVTGPMGVVEQLAAVPVPMTAVPAPERRYPEGGAAVLAAGGCSVGAQAAPVTLAPVLVGLLGLALRRRRR